MNPADGSRTYFIIGSRIFQPFPCISGSLGEKGRNSDWEMKNLCKTNRKKISQTFDKSSILDFTNQELYYSCSRGNERKQRAVKMQPSENGKKRTETWTGPREKRRMKIMQKNDCAYDSRSYGSEHDSMRRFRHKGDDEKQPVQRLAQIQRQTQKPLRQTRI